MSEQELLPGVWVDTAARLREYCEQDRHAYLYFDSLDPGTDRNDVEPADIWIANNLNGRIQLGEFAAIWQRVEQHRNALDDSLRSIPEQAALWRADEALLERAGDLLDRLCGPRAYGSRMTKILHKKRPDLFPIIDARVRPLFDAVVPPMKDRTWAEYFVELGRVVGPWIEKNAAVLDTARELYSPVTRLRAFDICLWKFATQGIAA